MNKVTESRVLFVLFAEFTNLFNLSLRARFSNDLFDKV